MTTPQPPAGWYPDPQDASQQRYWDGNAWSGHTAPSAATMSAPSGEAPQGAAIPAGAPAWQMPVDGAGVPGVPGKKPWFKRRWFLITAAVVVVLIVLGVVFGSGGDHSNALEKAILKDGQQQLQAAADKNVPGSKVHLTGVSCVETGDTQEYNCQIHLTLTSPDGSQTEKLLFHATGSCDSKASYHCLWHTEGDPVEDNS